MIFSAQWTHQEDHRLRHRAACLLNMRIQHNQQSHSIPKIEKPLHEAQNAHLGAPGQERTPLMTFR